MHQFSDRAGADQADIFNLVAHRVQAGPIGVKDRLVAADPDSELARGRALRPAAYWRVEHMGTALGELSVDPADQGWRVSRKIKIHRALTHPGDQTRLAVKRHPLDLWRSRQ